MRGDRIKALAIKILVAVGVIAGGVLAYGTGSADAFTFSLTNTNRDSGISVLITVMTGTGTTASCINVGGTAATPFDCLVVSFGTWNLTNTPLGIDMIGANTATSNVALTGSSPSGWDNQDCRVGPPGPTGCEMDGFGRFTSKYRKSAAGDLSIILDLGELTTITVPPNSHGANFAVHIRGSGGCSMFVSDGTAPAVTPSTECTPSRPPVPEPSPIALFGTGFAALTAFVKGRRFQLASA